MSKIKIETNLDKVYIVGEFCNWNPQEALLVKKKPKAKYINANLIEGTEYKILAERNWESQDKSHIETNRVVGNKDEIIKVYF